MNKAFVLLLLAVLVGIIGYYSFRKGDIEISYNTDIRPIINRKCIACHGGVKKAGGLSFIFREEALAVANSGLRAIVPGDPGASELIRRIQHHDPELRMPLESEPLSPDEITLIEDWIDQGAKWEEHWSFIPPQRDIQPPTFEKTSGPGIDQFLLSELSKFNLSYAGPANKEVLLRRVSLDLTGLPPTPDEARAFLQDPSEEAYEHLVDRLLSSPKYGERWASMWLDLARYADTKGYEKDMNRSIWKYRDWVIDAFNNDMPFDQFTIEQLAGDLLDQPSQDQLIATAFHRNTMANDEGGTDNEEFRVASVLDRVNTTAEAWLGSTMACVQCHGHPYDPIRHDEYYKFMAFFNNQADRDVYNEQPKLFTYEPEDEEKAEKIIAWLSDIIEKEQYGIVASDTLLLYEKNRKLLYDLGYRKVEAEEFHTSSKLIELIPPNQDAVWQVQDSSWIMFRNVDLTKVASIDFRCATALPGGFIDVRLGSLDGPKIGTARVTQTGSWEGWYDTRPDDKNWKLFRARLSPIEGIHDVYYVFRQGEVASSHLFHFDWIFYNTSSPTIDNHNPTLKRKLDELYSIPTVSTPVLKELSEEESRVTQVFHRGNRLEPGDTVEANIPAVFGGLPADFSRDRLGLSKWLVSEDNPLTARVMVNRIWEQFFGYGIVETMEEFGSQGTPPVNQNLLDWLAVGFMHEHQWSMKRLIKQMVMSKAYQQSSVATDEKLELDPYNRMISRGPRMRLSAEQIRDQILAVSGLINPKMYGPSYMPERPDSVMVYGSQWIADTTDNQLRRTLYVFGKRTNPYPMLSLFDATPRNICTSRRIRTNTPLQALTTLNEAVFYRAAEKLSEFMIAEGSDIDSAIEEGYERIMFKEIDRQKLGALKDLYWSTVERPNPEDVVEDQELDKKAMTLVANTLLNLDEFLTKN